MANLTIGTAGWSYDSWVGPFYPGGTLPRDYLSEYAKYLDAVEINSTFYAIPRASYVQRWAEVTPEGFLFCPKMVQTVTHEKQLVDAEQETLAFLDTTSLLGEKLGPVVLQFHYRFGPENLEVLRGYLRDFPDGFRLAVEVRNRKWLNDEFYRMLSEHSVALVLSDLYYMPRLKVVTTDFTYIRWLGRRQDVPDDSFSEMVKERTRELEWWAERVERWLATGTTVYAFANNRYQGHAPATVALFLNKLREAMQSKPSITP